MNIRDLTENEIKEVYGTHIRADFPPGEVKPLSKILELLGDGKYACLGLFDGGGLLAYAFIVLAAGGFSLLDYYAVLQGRRDNGIGGKFLERLKERFERFLIEVDDPDFAGNPAEKEKRERREKFYKRHGGRDSGARTLFFGVNYRIFYMSPEEEKKEKIAAALSDVYLSMMPRAAFERYFKFTE